MNVFVKITPADLTDARIVAMLDDHLADMHLTSPPESIHALDLSGLHDGRVTVWAGWDRESLLCLAALKELDASHGEIKSMRTAPASRGTGLAAVMLTFVMDQARERGYSRLSLETGSQEFFAPARRLYERHGFEWCEPFGDYVEDPNSVFMTRVL